MPEIEAYGMEWADVYLGLRGAHNLHEHADIPAEVLATNQAAMGKISTKRWQQTRWCLIRVPNASLAQAGRNRPGNHDGDVLRRLPDRLESCVPDDGRRWPSDLEGSRQVRIAGRETDLSFSVEGRKWLALDGKINMPDGEILTAPVNSTLDGQIYFEFPGVLGGRLMHDYTLALEGRRTRRGFGFDKRRLSAEHRAHRPRRFAAGRVRIRDQFRTSTASAKISCWMRRSAARCHIALGRAYPECGGDNQSAIHWDIVKDLRQEGAVYVDGRMVLDAGKLLL